MAGPPLITPEYCRFMTPFKAKPCLFFGNVQTNSNLLVTPTLGNKLKSRTTLPSIFAAYHPFLVSYPLNITVSLPEKNQLFISFRGEELRHNFVSHLINAFERHEIKLFVDKYEQRGKDLKHLLVRIEESRIALVIFSTRYTDSKWCMSELVKMRKLADEGKLHIIPIFYKVDASDVAKPTRESEFGRNFWKLVESSDLRDPIQEWREALECISNKMGLSLKDNSSEADFVNKIVKEVERVNEAQSCYSELVNNNFPCVSPCLSSSIIRSS